MRLIVSVVLLTFGILLATACGIGTAPEDEPVPSDVPSEEQTQEQETTASEPLVVALSAEPRSLDPTIDTIKSSLIIDLTILEPLAMNTAEGGYEPWLAESWEPVDPTTWRIQLKEGIQFHNGEPLNAEAVAFSVDVFLETTGEARGWFDYISDTEIIDEYTIDLITAEPTSMVPATFAYLFVFPPEYYAEVGTDGFGQEPIGTGPWQFKEWNKGVNLIVEPYDDYWGQKPAIGDIHFRWAPEASSRVALLETGDAHIIQNVPPALIERIDSSDVARVETAKSIRKAFLRMNLEEGPTADVRVRRALNHAIDVESIIETVFRGRAYGRDVGFILEGMNEYQGDSLEPYEYDPDLARELLTEAGYPDGFEITFWHTIGRYMLDKESAEAIAGQLNDVGITVDLQGMEPGAYFDKVSSERIPGLHFAASGPLFMTPLYHPLIEFQLDMPYGYGANDRTDMYTQEAVTEVDEAERERILHEFEEYVFYEHVPWVWLWHYQDIYGVSNDIDWTARSDELMMFTEVNFR